LLAPRTCANKADAQTFRGSNNELAASKPAKADPLASSGWAHATLPGEPVDAVDTSPRHVLAGRTHYFWAGDDLLAEAREGALTEYALWGFVAEALWENGQLRHVVNSQQGVAQELVDQSGKLVWQGTFDDWGKLIDEAGSTTCRLRLPGQIADDETGLHYNRFR
jgi:RHS protein